MSKWPCVREVCMAAESVASKADEARQRALPSTPSALYSTDINSQQHPQRTLPAARLQRPPTVVAFLNGLQISNDGPRLLSSELLPQRPESRLLAPSQLSTFSEAPKFRLPCGEAPSLPAPSSYKLSSASGGFLCQLPSASGGSLRCQALVGLGRFPLKALVGLERLPPLPSSRRPREAPFAAKLPSNSGGLLRCRVPFSHATEPPLGHAAFVSMQASKLPLDC